MIKKMKTRRENLQRIYKMLEPSVQGKQRICSKQYIQETTVRGRNEKSYTGQTTSAEPGGTENRREGRGDETKPPRTPKSQPKKEKEEPEHNTQPDMERPEPETPETAVEKPRGEVRRLQSDLGSYWKCPEHATDGGGRLQVRSAKISEDKWEENYLKNLKAEKEENPDSHGWRVKLKEIQAREEEEEA